MKAKSIIFITLTLALAFVVVFALAGWAAGDTLQPAADPGTVTVNGEAEIRIVPDEVVLRLGVETSDKVLNTAKQQNDQIVKRVFALAEQHAIPSEHIQTDYIHIEPRYDNYTQKAFAGYFVHNTVVITLRDLSQFEALLSDALEAGVNYVHSIQFRTTDLREYRDEARVLAIQAAREKAEAMAGTLGQKLGDPLAVREEANDWWSGYGGGWWGRWGTMTQNVIQEVGGTDAGFDGSLAPGQISIKARVNISFSIH